MQTFKAPDFLETGAVSSRSRSPSVVSTDSQFSRVNLMSPPTVRPPPAFISASAASEIISADQEFNAADFVPEDEVTGNGATALVTPAALSLLNGFLDNLLYNILASSKSTQMACIRPAMADVLKPRLAQEVVAAAEEELSEYMGGEEDEQTEFRGGQEPGGDFDLVRSWKLTRLRCMVYTRLGDMEEDDEDEFIAQDGLGENDGAPRRFTSHVDNITPAASIFLTSIIEYIGERALVIAGETARSRLLTQLNDDEMIGPEEERKRITRLVVEDLDMEKLALNATLGRLWRTWRKRRRGTTISRTLSRESIRRRGYSMANSRKSSIATIEEPIAPREPVPPVDVPPPFDPATVPLPMSDYDVQEIEVPGYVGDLEGEVQTMEAVVAHKVRPRSLMVFSSPSLLSRSPGSATNSPLSASAIEPPKSFRHHRTRSLPTGAPPPDEEELVVPEDQPSPTPSEKKQLETMYEDDESAEFVDAAEDAVETTPGIAITTEPGSSRSPEAAESSDDARRSTLHEEAVAPPAVNETIASLRAIADDEDLTDQTNSARISIASLGDRPNQKDPEVIEGTGTCEKPKLTSEIQRPKRQPSRDILSLQARSISPQTSDSQMHAVEGQIPTQGIESTPPSVTPVEAVTSTDQDATDQDQNKTMMISTPSGSLSEGKEDTQTSKSQGFPLEDSRPNSASGDSQRSKIRPRPAPLVVAGSNLSPSSERAAVQRMGPRPSTSGSPSLHSHSRRSGSFGSAREIKRPVTAGSTTSQVSSRLKGLMGRPQGDGHSLRLRSSSETSRASGASADSADNDIADLDKLINSDETIHFTLTPKSVREMSFPEPPSRPIPRSTALGADSANELLKTNSPSSEEKHRARASVSSKATGATAGTAGTGSSGGMTTASRTRSIESKHIPNSARITPTSSISTSRSNKAAQARDERAPADSTNDFAEFMRLTGPPPASTNAPPSAPANAAASMSPEPKTPASIEPKTPVSNERPKPVRPPSSQSVASRATATSRATTTSRGNRPRLQARSAETNGSSSDLIDFIREGPPMPAGAHRIPRTVAPFRNTIDSDDLHIDATSSTASTGNGVTPDKSMSSLGSRTGLLDSAKQNNATASGSAMAFDDPQPPARKQRRVPDPYAIDDDDDDELLEELLELEENPKPKREEESMMDFLRSAPPPPSSDEPPQPFLTSNPASNGSSGTSGMKARLLRGTQNPLRPQNTAPKTPANYSAKVGQERFQGSMPNPSNRKTDTSDLADFLRNSEPPRPPQPAPKPKDGGFARFFTRRKKTEA
ncbi:unnamed protein product [Penicillium salamii]|uniref:Flo11 n=1 Tax=Penicillium salamii TaxID=1612424 RepID=A0A9W4IYL5_9EURO|nr:unnamed protein product [Penicillium salamii]CAG8358077.1 unnamed protein product [Penicillium salamii]CAG8373961.1 unnamed protein product [Penicillium salamii]CAG8377117.1 unnamed protein product [Penicillium salamii]